MSRGNDKPVKVVLIETQYVETDAKSFKSVVQKLTGKDSVVGVDRTSGGLAAKTRAAERSEVGERAVGSLSMSRVVSFKEFDGLLMELPPLDELLR